MFFYDKMCYISDDINGKKPLSECRVDSRHYTRNLVIEAFIVDHQGYSSCSFLEFRILYKISIQRFFQISNKTYQKGYDKSLKI